MGMESDDKEDIPVDDILSALDDISSADTPVASNSEGEICAYDEEFNPILTLMISQGSAARVKAIVDAAERRKERIKSEPEATIDLSTNEDAENKAVGENEAGDDDFDIIFRLGDVDYLVLETLAKENFLRNVENGTVKPGEEIIIYSDGVGKGEARHIVFQGMDFPEFGDPRLIFSHKGLEHGMIYIYPGDLLRSIILKALPSE